MTAKTVTLHIFETLRRRGGGDWPNAAVIKTAMKRRLLISARTWNGDRLADEIVRARRSLASNRHYTHNLQSRPLMIFDSRSTALTEPVYWEHMTGKQRIPRFRMVLEVSFPDADPNDPSGYQEMISRWKESLQNNQALRCQQVWIREVLTIGDVDDYDDWRNNRGEYDVSAWHRDENTSIVSGRKKPDKES
jgi:hypothetical protein